MASIEVAVNDRDSLIGQLDRLDADLLTRLAESIDALYMKLDNVLHPNCFDGAAIGDPPSEVAPHTHRVRSIADQLAYEVSRLNELYARVDV